MESLIHCSPNNVPLSPTSFLEYASNVYGDKVSIVYGSLRFSWTETYERCLRLASALSNQLQVSVGGVIAALAPNIPALYELHFAVPMAGAVLSALNTKLDSATLALLLQQLEPKIIFVDYQFIEVVLKVFDIMPQRNVKRPLLVLIPDYFNDTFSSLIREIPSGILHYNALLKMGQSDFKMLRPNNECDPISVSFTSGSTGIPKGAVYSHRAAYLNSLAAIFRVDMRQMPVFLWTVDMFRCNGWCFTWAVAALGGTNVCLRNVSAKIIFDAIDLHKVTHLCGAPALLNMLADAPAGVSRQISSRVHIIVAGALPGAQILMKVEELGFDVSYGYGMTEALGPAIVRPCKYKGLHNLIVGIVDVKDPNSMDSTPCDGKTIGEIMFRGNTLMSGYLKNPNATQEAFRGGWYHTGDLGIKHPDGNFQMKDRSKDIIFSGGEAVSSMEVEAVLLNHPKVLEAAVVGKQDDCLGEKPFAFVKLKEGCDARAEDIIEFCGEQMTHYMVPCNVIFEELPVNSIGKVQKFVLREKANGRNMKNMGLCKLGSNNF